MERVGQVRHRPPDTIPKRAGDEAPVRTAQPLVPGSHPVPAIAHEELVRAFPGQHHLRVRPSQLGHEVQRDARWIGDRLVLVPDQPGQGSPEVLR